MIKKKEEERFKVRRYIQKVRDDLKKKEKEAAEKN